MGNECSGLSPISCLCLCNGLTCPLLILLCCTVAKLELEVPPTLLPKLLYHSKPLLSSFSPVQLANTSWAVARLLVRLRQEGVHTGKRRMQVSSITSCVWKRPLPSPQNVQRLPHDSTQFVSVFRESQRLIVICRRKRYCSPQTFTAPQAAVPGLSLL